MGVNVNVKDFQGRLLLYLVVMNYQVNKINMVNMLIIVGVFVIDLDMQGMNLIYCFIDKCRLYFEDDFKLFLEIFNFLGINCSEVNFKNVIG